MPVILDQSTYLWDRDDDEEDIVLYDISTRTGSSAFINGAYFFSAQPLTSSGTGLIQAFVRVQDGGNDETPGIEDGYNTDARPLLHEENSSPTFTTNLSLADVPVVTLEDGNSYLEFRLDINQLNSSQFLSLDELYVMIGGTAVDVTGLFDANGDGVVDAGFLTDNGLSVLYDLDGNANSSLLLDYSLQAGSGRSDMFFYVPTSSLTADQLSNPENYNITLYSKFGELGDVNEADGSITALTDGDVLVSDVNGDGLADGSDGNDSAGLMFEDYSSNDGFEEWSVSKTIPGVEFTGYKWHDLDGDATWDVGELALPGWQINYTVSWTITYKGNQTANPPTSDQLTASAVTDEDGQYTLGIPTFTDNQIASVEYTLTIHETLQGGWANTYGGFYDSINDLIINPTVLTFTAADIDGKGGEIDRSGDFGIAQPLNFANFELFDISGTKFIDTDGDGELEAGETTTLAGVRVYIDFNGNESFDADEKFAITDASGNWSITGLDASFIGKSVFEDLSHGDLDDDYYQTVGEDGLTINTTSGEDVTELDFGNVAFGRISGTKFEDGNGDGSTEGDSGIVGWNIYLFASDPGDTPDPTAADYETTTGAGGAYSFEDLPLGTYWLVEESRAGWVATKPVEIEVTGTGTSGFDVTDQDFANFELFDISGTKFIDTDGDGELEAGETTTLAGVRVYIDFNGNESFDADEKFAITDASGNWSITGLDASFIGKSVFEDLSHGDLDDDYYQTVGEDGLTINTTSGEDVTELDFGNVAFGRISGTKFEDGNGDGSTEGDSGIVGWNIYLFASDPGDTPDPTAADYETTTGAGGAYSFEDLPLGTYWLVEESRAGWVATKPVEIEVTGTGTSGFDVTDQDFANFELFDISGTKFIDTDGDGELEAGETTTLAGVRVYIDFNGNESFDADEKFAITDASGNWSITGLDASFIGKSVFEDLSHGDLDDDYYQTVGEDGLTINTTSGEDVTELDFGNVAFGRISGTKFEDGNGDGSTEGDSGIVGWNIYLFASDPGDTPDPTAADYETTTGAGGAYSFEDLPLGTYWLVEESRAGWVATKPVEIEVTGTGTSGFDVTDQDFANFELFDISGTKFIDTDGDGELEAGETTTLAGVRVYIDFNGNESFDADEKFAITDASGNWSITGLDASFIGKSVFEDLSHGDLDDDYYQTVGEDGLTINTTSGEDVTELDFGNVAFGRISGKKLEDSDGDVTSTGDRSDVAGWTIELYDSAFQLVDSTTTGADGSYEFDDLPIGDYYVREETRTGWTNLTLVEVSLTGLASGFDETVNFVNFADMMISGYKWADVNGNGQWDELNTAVLSGWEIVLDSDSDPTNGVIASTTTDAEGYYEFAGLNPVDFPELLTDGDGFLHVYEAQQDGFTQTYGGFSFAIASGTLIAGTLGEAETGNFGNHVMEGANRTPGFWQSTLGKSLYNGIDGDEGDANGDGVPDGNKNFEEEGWSETDLMSLYGVDTDSNGVKDHFAVWDANGNGSEDSGDIFLTVAELSSWVSGGAKGGGRDFVGSLERDLGAAFLNSLNNDAIGGDPGGNWAIDPNIADSYSDAVRFIRDWDPDFDGTASGNKKQQQSDWNDYGSDAHKELSAFNENGEAMFEGALLQVLMDGDDYSNPLVQNYLAVREQLQLETAPIQQFSSTTIEDDMMVAQTMLLV